MLTVKTPDEVLAILEEAFPPSPAPESVGLEAALGRVLFADVLGREYVPDFHRSMVDGYAVRAADTFGCSDALPALLALQGEVLMGKPASDALKPGCCMAVPTGGEVPANADAVVMLEYAEDYGDGTISLSKPAAPGQSLIYRGDDTRPGRPVLSAGRRLTAADIGALAAMGVADVTVCKRLTVGVLSTGDELVPAAQSPAPGQVRDVNTPMLCAFLLGAGAAPCRYPIVPDDEALLGRAVDEAARNCDMVLLSGGSSVGAKDAASRVLESRGELLLHGVAMKPGKPTLLGKISGKPVWGLPGHPVAACFVALLFVRPLLARLTGETLRAASVSARLTEALSANDGRAQYVGVALTREGDGWLARPIHGKSGLITTLAGCDGYLCIPRDCEGLPAGAQIAVTLLV